MIRHLWRFRALDDLDRRLVVEAATLLLLTRTGLHLVRFPRLCALLDRYARQRSDDAAADVVGRIRRSIEMASKRMPWSITCLVKALAAEAMLRRRGLASQLHLGVLGRAATREQLEAHAWVECDGMVVIGDIEGLSNYARLSAIRPASPIDALCKLLRLEEVPWVALNITPEDVVDACVTQGVYGLIHERLRTRDGCGDWPHEIRDRLSALVRAEAAREALRQRETTATLDALAAEGIRPILLKGAPLAYSVYDGPTSRPRRDTDLLVRRDEVETVKRVLHGRGYVAPPYCDGELLFCQFELSKTDEFGIDHAFDVHWRISTQVIFADVLGYKELAAESVAVPTLGRAARGAGPVHALLLACIHPVMHHRSEQRLLWTYDVHLLASSLSAGKLERFARLAVKKSVAAICVRQLDLASSQFGTVVPGRTLAMLSAPALTEPSAGYLTRNRRWHHELIASLRALPSWSDRLQLAREVLLPSPRYMLAAYRLQARSRSTAILPVLYAHRVLHGVWKVMTGRK